MGWVTERGVGAALGLIQTVLVPGGGNQAVEALGGVEVEVGGGNAGGQAQEPLSPLELGEGVPDQGVSVHHVDLRPGEAGQPAAQVQVVQTALEGLVGGVHRAVRPQQQVLQRRVGLPTLPPVVQDLRVVRHQPLRRVTYNQ